MTPCSPPNRPCEKVPRVPHPWLVRAILVLSASLLLTPKPRGDAFRKIPLEPSTKPRTVSCPSIILMLNSVLFAHRRLQTAVNPRKLAPVHPFAFSQLPPLVALTLNKASSFSYLLRRPWCTPQCYYHLQASLEVAQTRPYSGASHV